MRNRRHFNTLVNEVTKRVKRQLLEGTTNTEVDDALSSVFENMSGEEAYQLIYNYMSGDELQDLYDYLVRDGYIEEPEEEEEDEEDEEYDEYPYYVTIN